MRISVTGANGMVGRALRARLAAEPGMEGRYIGRGAPRYSGDVIGPDLASCTADDWRDALAGTDTVVHLAAALPWSTNDSETLARINVEGARTLAEASQKAGVRRFIFVSTLGVHGITSGASPFTPNSPIVPSGDYAKTKYAAEEVLRALCSDTGMELVILRPPIVYGPGVGGKVGMLVARIAKGSRLPLGRITGNRRQMIGADNLADVILLTCRHEGAPGPALLPADADAVSTQALLEMLAQGLGRPLRLTPVPEGVFYLVKPLPVIGGIAERLIGNVEIADTRLRQTLGWTPPRSLQEGIDDVIAGMVKG